MLQQKIRDQIKTALLAKDKVRLDVLRGILSAFTNELMAKGKKPQDELLDEDALVVISRLAKQRKDSIEQFTKGGREDLVKEEEEQLAILTEYLPTMMARADVEKIAMAKKEELGITDKSKQGQLMSALMKDLKGKADGMVVKEVVESILI
jgi:uncharacterized protein YqeY